MRTVDAIRVVERFFSALNRHDACTAERTQFVPSDAPAGEVEAYVAKMMSSGPYDVRSVEVDSVDEPRLKRHGVVGSVWVRVSVADPVHLFHEELIPVWWFPDNDGFRVAVRLSHWLS